MTYPSYRSLSVKFVPMLIFNRITKCAGKLMFSLLNFKTKRFFF